MSKYDRSAVEPLEDRQLLAAPVVLSFDGTQGGLVHSGFTSVQATTRGRGLFADRLQVANGKLEVTAATGTMDGSHNSQTNALQIPIQSFRDFQVSTLITSIPLTANGQEAGIFVGINEDNFVKVTLGHSNGGLLRFITETNGNTRSGGNKRISFPGINQLELRLIGSVTTGTVTAQYRVNSAGSGAWVNLGQATNNAVFRTGTRAGIAVTRGEATPFTVAYDSFTVQSDAALPFIDADLAFDGNDGGVLGTGFGNVLPTKNGTGLVSQDLNLANGKLTVTTTDGDFVAADDSQDNALYWESNLSHNWVLQTRLDAAPFTQRLQSAGIWVGTSQHNYVKVIAGFSNEGNQIVELARECDDQFIREAQPHVNFAGVTTLDLRLIGEAGTKTVTAQYRINSNSDNDWVTVGQTVNASGFFAYSKAGIVTTQNGGAVIQVPLESFRLQTDVQTLPTVG